MSALGGERDTDTSRKAEGVSYFRKRKMTCVRAKINSDFGRRDKRVETGCVRTAPREWIYRLSVVSSACTAIMSTSPPHLTEQR